MTPTIFWAAVHALAVTAVGLIAGTALAHVLEMPHKLAMDAETWLAVQGTLYQGWGAKLLWLDLVALAALLALALRLPAARVASAVAVTLLLLADVAVFHLWIAPTNAAVSAADAPMAGWEALRRNWEWGHAARAALLTAATLAAALAAPSRGATVRPA